MPNTFTLIASSTVGSGGASSIVFNSIPNTYTDLCLKFSGRGTRSEVGSNWLVSFNGSTSNFSARYVEGVGTTVATGTFARFLGVVTAANATANTFGNTEVYIPNYLSNINKSYSSNSSIENNATLSSNTFIAGLWSDTSAITSITITSGSSDNIVQNSTAYLYGIIKS